MTRTRLLQEFRRKRLEDASMGQEECRLTRGEAARFQGACARTIRRHVSRYKGDGLDGLLCKRLSQVLARRAPTNEVLRTKMLVRERYDGWIVKHHYSFNRREHAGQRGYAWWMPGC